MAEAIEIHRRGGNRSLTGFELSSLAAQKNQPGIPASKPSAETLLLADKLLELGVSIVTFADPEYPNSFEWLGEHAPSSIYVRGNLNLLRQPAVGIIGTRRPTAYGMRAARSYARRLAECEITVVSGNAPGIDAAAHDQALREGGSTIIFPAVPIEQFVPAFPAELDWQRVVVISSLPPGTAVQPWCFLRRNALVAAVAECVLVAETGTRGGTLDTVARVRAMGKAVYVTELPPDAKWAEAHRMLAASGACLVPPEPTAASLKLLSRQAVRRPSMPDKTDLFSTGNAL